MNSKSKLASAIARADAAEARALDARIALALSRKQTETLQREIAQRLSANIRTTVDKIVPASDLPGWFDVSAQLASDPSLISLAALSIL